MTSVRIPPVLTGAALALILATPGFAQAQSSDQQSAGQGQAAQVPAEVTPELTADAARNAGAAGQVVQQLEAAQLALEEGDADAAREALGQAKEMLQKAKVEGGADQLLEIEAHLEGASAALEAGDTEKAQAAIGAAASGMIEIEQASAEQGQQQDTAAQAAGQGQQETQATAASNQGQSAQQATAQPGQQDTQQPAAASGQQAAAQSGQQATGQGGRQQTLSMTDQGGQSGTQAGGKASMDALRDARDALEMARQEVESALQAVQDAEAALGQTGSSGMAAGGGTAGSGGISVTVLDQGDAGASGEQQATGSGGGAQMTTAGQGQAGATEDQQSAAAADSDEAATTGQPETLASADRQPASGSPMQVTVVEQGETGTAGGQQSGASAGSGQGAAEGATAGQQPAAGEEDAQLTVVEQSETESLPAASDEQQQVPQPQPQSQSQLSAEETNRLLAAGDREIGEASEMLTMTIADLSGRDVVTFDGEKVGEIGQMVTNGQNVYAIVEHGGFLGIGENKVAIPASRLGIRGDEIVLLGLSQEQLEQMPEYDFASGQELGQEQSIEIGRYN